MPMSTQTEIVHGVFIEVLETGVLIKGSDGIGKSALALELISRGHRLIADDAPEFHSTPHSTVIGTCPPLLQDFIAVSGLGVLNVPAMFGANAVKKAARLQLLISLVPQHLFKMVDDEQLRGSLHQQSVLGVAIPQINLPIMPGQNMAVMVEIAVRNYTLRIDGYNAAEIFINRQQAFLEGNR